MNDSANNLISHFRGSPALSEFRLQKLFQDLRLKLPSLQEVYAEFIHFVNLTAPLSDAEIARLQQVLHYGPHEGTKDISGTSFLVVPRIGTISPWSTKATDIVHHCGLEKVVRAERGTVWTFRFAGDKPADDKLRELILPQIHDRMTESILSDAQQAAALFKKAEPAPLRIVDVLGGDREALDKANSEFGLALSDDEIELVAIRRISN